MDCAKNVKVILIDYVVAGVACVVRFSQIQIQSKAIFMVLTLTDADVLLLPVTDLIDVIMLYTDFSIFILKPVSVNFL